MEVLLVVEKSHRSPFVNFHRQRPLPQQSLFLFIVVLQDIEATIHCAEWLCIIGGSSTEEQRVRKSFCMGFVLEHSQLAFSHPTSSRKALASNYIGGGYFLVYTTNNLKGQNAQAFEAEVDHAWELSSIGY